MIDPESLTGAYVEQVRKANKLSRQKFYDMVGWTGKSVARLMNIESHDSWKDGDRERVAAVLDTLMLPAGQQPVPQPEAATGQSDSEAYTNSQNTGDPYVQGPPAPYNPAFGLAPLPPMPGTHPAWSSAEEKVVLLDSSGNRVPESDDPFAASKRFLAGVVEQYADRSYDEGGVLPLGSTAAANETGFAEPVVFSEVVTNAPGPVPPDPVPGYPREESETEPVVPIMCDEEDEDDCELATVEPAREERVLSDSSGIEWRVGPEVTDAEAIAAGLIVPPPPVPPAYESPFKPVDHDGPHHELQVPPRPTEAEFDELPIIDVSGFEEVNEDEVEPDGAFNITNSQVQAFKRCKRKWWLEWYRNLEPRNEDLLNARSTGTRVHAALQAYYVPEGQTPVDPRDALERVLTEDWTKLVTAAREKGHDEFVVEELTAKFNKSAELERAMVEGYMEWLKETGADQNLKVIGSEQTIKVHLFDYMRVDGQVQPVNAMGLIDVRAYRTTDGARLFVDHKTVGDLKTPVAQLTQNEQMLHYHLLEWLATAAGEERCDGALYNMLRKVKRTARATPPFYDRYEVRHNQVELETYRRRLIAETRDLLHMTERLDAGADPLDVAYPSPTRNCSWDCDFFAVCSMFDDGSHVEVAIESLFRSGNPNDRYEPAKGAE